MEFIDLISTTHNQIAMIVLKQIPFYLGLRKLDPQVVRTWLWQQDSCMLVFALKSGSAKIRSQVVSQLRSVNPQDRALIRQLTQMVRKDFLGLAQSAAVLLEPILPQLGTVTRRKVQRALDQLRDRIRRDQNRSTVFRQLNADDLPGKLVDKSKMKQLEKVRQQLKKSIRLW